MTKEDELTAGLQAELARVNARIGCVNHDCDQCKSRERNFCERCGKRLGGEGHIHTCTPPAPQPVPVKTYSGGKPWPVAPSDLNPEHIIRQLVTALEGSGTRLRSDQWYVEIEAVAAGKRYLAEMALLGREKMDEEHRVGFDGPDED
jgi:hypothetical protein